MAKIKSFQITCRGADLLIHSAITEFQGELKSLSRDNYERLKKEILELGFSEPLSVWDTGLIHEVTRRPLIYVLNGHQRLRTVRAMEREGYQIPALPIVWIQAASAAEAARKCLALTSQYGSMEQEGLYEFMHLHQISMDELEASFRFPEVKMAAFRSSYFEAEVPEELKAEELKSYKLEVSFPDDGIRRGVFEELKNLGYEVKLK